MVQFNQDVSFLGKCILDVEEIRTKDGNLHIKSNNGLINVKDFGAKGNGVTDDAPIIREALAQAINNKSGLYFPNGIYFLGTYTDGSSTHSSAGTNKTILKILNNAATILKGFRFLGHGAKLTTNLYPTNIAGSSQTNTLEIIGNIQDLIIEGIEFENVHPLCNSNVPNQGNYYGKIFGIQTFWSSGNVYIPKNIKIHNCIFKDHTIDINLWAGDEITIDSCSFRSTWGKASSGLADWSVGIGSRPEIKKLIVTNCKWNGCEADNISTLELPNKLARDGLVLATGGSIIITNNQIIRNTFEGIYVLGEKTDFSPENGCIISNNFIDGEHPVGHANHFNYGIRCDKQDSIISNNVIRNCSHGIQINSSANTSGQGGAYNVVVSNNNIRLASKTHENGYSGTGIAITYCYYFKIIGNKITGYEIKAQNMATWNGSIGGGNNNVKIPTGIHLGASHFGTISDNDVNFYSKETGTYSVGFSFDDAHNIKYLNNSLTGVDFVFRKTGGGSDNIICNELNSLNHIRLFAEDIAANFGLDNVDFNQKKPFIRNFNNENINISNSFNSNLIFQNGTLTASRTITLKATSSFPPGYTLSICDFSGSVTSTNKIIINAFSGDTINGLDSLEITEPYKEVLLRTNGINKWIVVY